MSANKPLRELDSFDALIAQRKESTGGDGKTFTVPGFGRDWHLAAPGLQTSEWNDRYTELHADLRDGLVSMQDYRAELVDLFLGEKQGEAFIAACEDAEVDAAQLVNWALEKYQEDQAKNRSRPSSPTTPRRAKRR